MIMPVSDFNYKNENYIPPPTPTEKLPAIVLGLTWDEYTVEQAGEMLAENMTIEDVHKLISACEVAEKMLLDLLEEQD